MSVDTIRALRERVKELEGENQAFLDVIGETQASLDDARRERDEWKAAAGTPQAVFKLEAQVQKLQEELKPYVEAKPMRYPIDPDEIKSQRRLGWPHFHPEDYCHRCGAPNPSWFVSRELWDEAGGDSIASSGIVCPACFADAWEKATGLKVTWELRLDPSWEPTPHLEQGEPEE